MPSPCSMPDCHGNYKKGFKVSSFAFPKDEALRAKWLDAVHRADFRLSKYSRVCELHFEPSDVIREASVVDPKTGRTLTARLSVPRLQNGAVPTRFIPPPGPLVKKTTDAAKMASRKRKQAEKTLKRNIEVADASLLQGLLQTDPANVAASSAVIKEEPIESSEKIQPSQTLDNIFVVEELTPPSRNLSHSSSLSSSSNLPPSPPLISLETPKSSPTTTSSQTSDRLVDSSSSASHTNLQSSHSLPLANTSQFFIDLLSSSSNRLLHSSNSSPSNSSSLSSENSLPVENLDSIILSKMPTTNKLDRKRRSNANSELEDSTSRPSKAKIPLSSSNRPSGISKNSAGRSNPRINVADNTTRDIFYSLNGSESNSLFGSRTSERPGDLFDVFADFIAHKLREMNWDTCSFALRSILDIVFYAGQVNLIEAEREGNDVHNPDTSISTSSDQE